MTTEQDMLEMSDHFKVLLKKKNKELGELKKLLCVLYGLIRVCDEHEDISFVELIRMYLSRYLNKMLDIDENDLEE